MTIALPGLGSVETVLAGIKSDAKRQATRRGHSMMPYVFDRTDCRHCQAYIEVRIVHRFRDEPMKIAYLGTAFKQGCSVKDDPTLIERNRDGPNALKQMRYQRQQEPATIHVGGVTTMKTDR